MSNQRFFFWEVQDFESFQNRFHFEWDKYYKYLLFFLSFLLHSITSPHPTWRTSFNIPVQVFVLLDIFCVRFPSSQNNCHVRVLRSSSPSGGLILWSHRRLASLDPLSPPPSRSLWLAPFPPLFVSFNMALCEQKHSRAQKKRLHCRIASYFIWV